MFFPGFLRISQDFSGFLRISGYFLGEKPWNIGTSMIFCTEDTVELEFDSTVITMKPTFNVA